MHLTSITIPNTVLYTYIYIYILNIVFIHLYHFDTNVASFLLSELHMLPLDEAKYICRWHHGLANITNGKVTQRTKVLEDGNNTSIQHILHFLVLAHDLLFMHCGSYTQAINLGKQG